ncbi:MAG: hydroxymethylbilane synthase [Alphaproteobacteria bacterium]
MSDPRPSGAGAAPLRLGTRGSALALAQSGAIARRVEATGVPVESVVIRTSGDRLVDVSLAKVGGKGLFLKEIEEALAAGEVDFAVHSMKDVPADLPAGFAIAAVPEREDVRDVLVAREPLSGDPLASLPRGARVGTGSLRRHALLRSLRPDVEVVAMRGNVDTRLRKLRDGDFDAIVLASAGLRRLGLDVGAIPLDPTRFLPAPGQGALALEVRAGDDRTAALLAPLHDPGALAACEAERSFLRELGASCQVPVAAHASAAGDGSSRLDGLVASLDGRTVLRDAVPFRPGDAREAGARLARILLDRGARVILDEAEREVGSV